MKEAGIILVDKPGGVTSHDVVDVVRKKLNMRRVGHAGTLDPMATGLLIILVGKATKLFNKFMEFKKTYSAIMKLGVVTDTGDVTGNITESRDASDLSEEAVAEAVKSFQGEIEQVPPMVSAVRHKGKRLYELAREGKVIERTPRKVTIDLITIDGMDLPLVDFSVCCSKGTYIRQLAEDIGAKLGVGGCITKIRRTAIGAYTIAQAHSMDAINESCVLSVDF